MGDPKPRVRVLPSSSQPIFLNILTHACVETGAERPVSGQAPTAAHAWVGIRGAAQLRPDARVWRLTRCAHALFPVIRER